MVQPNKYSSTQLKLKLLTDLNFIVAIQMSDAFSIRFWSNGTWILYGVNNYFRWGWAPFGHHLVGLHAADWAMMVPLLLLLLLLLWGALGWYRNGCSCWRRVTRRRPKQRLNTWLCPQVRPKNHHGGVSPHKRSRCAAATQLCHNRRLLILNSI